MEDALVDGSVVELSHCIVGDDKLGYFYSMFSKHFLSTQFVGLFVMVSDPKDSLDLLPFPVPPLPDPLLAS